MFRFRDDGKEDFDWGEFTNYNINLKMKIHIDSKKQDCEDKKVLS